MKLCLITPHKVLTLSFTPFFYDRILAIQEEIMLILSTNNYFLIGLHAYIKTKKFKTKAKVIIDFTSYVMILGEKITQPATITGNEISFIEWEYVLIKQEGSIQDIIDKIRYCDFKRGRSCKINEKEDGLLKFCLKGMPYISIARIKKVPYKKVMNTKKKLLDKLNVKNMNLLIHIIHEWKIFEPVVREYYR